MLRLVKNNKVKKDKLYLVLITNNRYNVINVKTNIVQSSWKNRLDALMCAKDLNNAFYRGLYEHN